LSDLTAGLIGGLGLTAGANIGKDTAIFEAVHGTAPDIAGKGIANPTAVMLAGMMLLEHIGERTAAERLDTAVREAIASKEAVTPDLGGSATTRMFTQAVVKRLK
jgi:isocitrate dehydrogenase (NAD+)